MKKGFLVSGCFFALAALVACSSDSNGTGPDVSGSGSGKKSSKNASQCDLATDRLPASSLEWKPTFAGGCEVVQPFELTELQAMDEELLSMGYQKTSLTAESYKYLYDGYDIEKAKAYKDTLTFVYALGTFSGQFSSASRDFTDAEKTRVVLFNAYLELFTEELLGIKPMILIENGGSKVVDPLDKSDYLMLFGKMAYTKVAFKNRIIENGWTCTLKNVSKDMFSCQKTYNGADYYFVYSINNPDTPNGRTITAYFSLSGYYDKSL